MITQLMEYQSGIMAICVGFLGMASRLYFTSTIQKPTQINDMIFYYRLPSSLPPNDTPTRRYTTSALLSPPYATTKCRRRILYQY